MGNLSALALQDEELGYTLEQQLSLHFQTNCYPPIPQQMIPTAIEAIDTINEGYGINPINLPEGVTFRGRTYATAWEIAESYRLGMWIIESELD
jgi:hypothetical protein